MIFGRRLIVWQRPWSVWLEHVLVLVRQEELCGLRETGTKMKAQDVSKRPPRVCVVVGPAVSSLA